MGRMTRAMPLVQVGVEAPEMAVVEDPVMGRTTLGTKDEGMILVMETGGGMLGGGGS